MKIEFDSTIRLRFGLFSVPAPAAHPHGWAAGVLRPLKVLLGPSEGREMSDFRIEDQVSGSFGMTRPGICFGEGAHQDTDRRSTPRCGGGPVRSFPVAAGILSTSSSGGV